MIFIISDDDWPCPAGSPMIRPQSRKWKDMATMAAPDRTAAAAPRSVQACVNYAGRGVARPRYFANDKSRDELDLVPHDVTVEDARTLATAPTLAAEGFTLVPAPTAMADFRDAAEVARVYEPEIRAIVERATGAALVLNTGKGVLRFAEGSAESGAYDNSLPARFIHNDVSEPTARAMAERQLAGRGETLADYAGFAYYNVWRPITPPPQNVPLAMLDTRTLDMAADLIAADAVFDAPGQPEWSFEGFLVTPSPRHRWVYYADMGAADAVLFTTFGYRDGQPFCVPHTGFDDPSVPADTPPRASIEMRCLAFFR